LWYVLVTFVECVGANIDDWYEGRQRICRIDIDRLRKLPCQQVVRMLILDKCVTVRRGRATQPYVVDRLIQSALRRQMVSMIGEKAHLRLPRFDQLILWHILVEVTRHLNRLVECWP